MGIPSDPTSIQFSKDDDVEGHIRLGVGQDASVKGEGDDVEGHIRLAVGQETSDEDAGGDDVQGHIRL
jgi:hypothetical protein